jgi:hypothetical protein
MLVSFISSFSRDLCASQAEEGAEGEPEVGNSYLPRLLRRNSRREYRKKFLVGLERPTILLGTETCAKVGSLQPNSVPFRGQFELFLVRNFLSFGHLLDRQGDR